MYLQRLSLRQFRSYTDLLLSVDPGVNLFLGLNGSGKTNLLEAIAVLTIGVSPRGGETESFIQWGQDGFFVQGQFGFDEDGIDPLTLEMKYRKGSSRIIRENGKKVVRLKDLIGRIPLVSFVPEDLSLVKGEPDLRRRAMSMILVQVDPSYAAELKRYNESLRSRNAALRQLRDGLIDLDSLKPWDEALIRSGLVLCQKRDEFLKDFSKRAGIVHERVSGGKETLGLVYKPSFEGPWDESAAERWQEKLHSIRSQEIALGLTLKGPHRDDVLFLLNDRPARAFGSEGQKRTAAVSFKLAEIPFIQERRGQKPICLLDDVLSELDVQRAAHLLDELSRTGQCFVTLTGLESWPAGQKRPASIYRVDETGVALEGSHSPSPVAG